jgi:hypothetical protein
MRFNSSSASGGREGVAAVEVGWPHEGQNLAPSVSALPHAKQDGTIADPQFAQKRAPAPAAAPHSGQVIFRV